MSNRNAILSKLSPFSNRQDLLSLHQTVPDIIAGIKKCHQLYAGEYDKIYSGFLDNNAYDTGLRIFNFLRRNTFYHQESEQAQTLRSPAAIVATGDKMGLDCKNYAMFAGGILDAINRNTNDYIPFVYRFVSDKPFDKTPNHVFIVMYPDEPIEEQIWIDPIPEVPRYNYHLPYTYATDKKISGMSLYQLSGATNSRMAGGAFGIGEGKLRQEMNQFISQYPTAFLYLFLPTGQPNQGQDHGMNTAPAVPGLPQTVLDKKQKAFTTAWNWGMPTGLDTVTQIWPAIRNAVTSRIGMSPEAYWSKALGVVINTPTIGDAGSMAQIANVILPGSGSVAQLVTGFLSSFVPNLTWTYTPDQFQPLPSDWAGSKWAGLFVTDAQGNLQSSGSGLNINALIPSTTQAGISPLVLFGLGGAVLYFFTKK